MNPTIKIFWLAYFLFILVPVFVSITILLTLVTIIGCSIGCNKVCDYYPGMIWSRILCFLSFCPVTVEGRENIQKGQSYIFASNHTSIYDVFVIYGYIGVDFKWIMKKELENIPFIGWACKSAGFLFINRKKGREAFKTLQEAKDVFKGGTSLVIFPEGTRTPDGLIGKFKRGAFEIAQNMDLPIIPVCLQGGFKVMPKTRFYPIPGPLKITILPPIEFSSLDHEDFIFQVEKIREQIVSVANKPL